MILIKNKLRGNQVDRIVSSNRRQRVRMNGFFSLWREVLIGISQGSILGLLGL